MGFLHDIKIKILKRSIEKALRENIFLRGFEALFLENEIALNHCCADELTAEEAILYTLREYLKTPPAFSSLRYLASSIPWGEYESPENTSKGDWWFWVSKKWRDEGKVELSQFEKFLEQLDFTKKKWPQIFSGEDLTTARSYWEVHFNSYPVGLGTTRPSDIGDKTNIKARFYGFQKAVQYVKNNALEELWWHYYNLGVVKDGHVDYWPPAWEANEAPISGLPVELPFDRRPELYYHSDSVSDSPYANAICLSAMPKHAYDHWLENDIVKKNFNFSEPIPRYFQNTWLIRKVEVTLYIEDGQRKVMDYENEIDLSQILAKTND